MISLPKSISMKYLLLLTALLFLVPDDATAQGRKKRKQIDKVIAEARTYLGTPYRFGGMSRKGIDCSGLIYNCYKTIDVSLPRNAKSQSKMGKSVSWEEVRPGDIVYFKFKQKGEKWDHTGMVVRADRKDIRFIHASTSRGVIESSLNESYYKDNVRRFRRVIR